MHEIDKTKLSDQTKYRLYEIIIWSMRSMKENHAVNKYVTIFDYLGKLLIVLKATSSGVSIISFASTVGVPAGRASASFTLIFSIAAGITSI